MDTNIGRILDQVEEQGLRERTVIWFLGDNGFNCGHHGLWGKGNASFPLNMYDESVLVPAIVSQPGRIPEGEVRSGMVSTYDFAMTLLDSVGLELPDAAHRPGQSFRHLLNAESPVTQPVHRDVVIFDEYGPVRMIRSEDWKYVHRYPYGPHELYALVKDPRERVNLIDVDDSRSTIEQLRGQLEQWFLAFVDPAVDGLREPVTGTGQVDRAGIANGGRLAYMQDQRLEQEAALRQAPRALT